MKKITLLLLALATLLPLGCAKETTTDVPPVGNMNFSVLKEKKEIYPYNWDMKLPELSGMTNRNAIQFGFHEKWTTDFVVPDMDFSTAEYKEFCTKEGFTLVNTDNRKELKKIPYAKFKAGAKFAISDTYNGNGLALEFSPGEKSFLSSHGRTIIKTNSGFRENMKDATTYEGGGDMPGRGGDERADNYNRIGGSSIPYQRYPYNTLFITSDLLLHLYHRLFDNSLKYYEESTARPMISDLSKSMFDKFTKLASTAKDTNLKNTYEFLAAYRAIPNAILMSNDELLAKINTNMDNGSESPDLSDEQIQTRILQRFDETLPKLSETYKDAAKSTLEEILKATNTQGENLLITALDPNFMTSFPGFSVLKFDYTQFTPRAHYTTDSLLKTYFMGMKRMMRQKLFFANGKAAGAALVMVNNLQDKDLQNFTAFYDFILKLIGKDDDTNITDIQTFLSKKGRTSDAIILQSITPDIQKELLTIRPQKIMSVSYITLTEKQVTEEQAKNMTDGFIFFGEKFTIDSRLFDQFTAGTAEKEIDYKPEVQSALMVVDNLINTPLTTKFAKLWLERNKELFKITDSQIAGYDSVKTAVMNNQELTGFDFGQSTYHRRLDMLGWLFLPRNGKIPYFMADPLYQDKVLNTYLGSYTELKHDTLLYVKQAYAELGGGGDGPCVFAVEPPALPVPKGYVEPNIELIDTLMALTKDTNLFFKDKKYEDFLGYLSLVKKIGIAQTQNGKISDEDFDSLRLYSNQLQDITTPTKYFGEPLQKEKRGALIADIFTSGKYGPLYEAVGRPYLMALEVNDINGARIVLGPVFSHYEFYPDQSPVSPSAGGRLNDQDRQNGYDALQGQKEIDLLSLPLQELINATK